MIFCSIFIAFTLNSCDSASTWLEIDGRISQDQDALIRKADSIFSVHRKDLLNAIPQFEEIISISKEKGYKSAAAIALYYVGYSKTNTSDFQNAYDYLKEAYQFADPKDDELRAMILNLMASNYARRFNLQTADSLLTIAEGYARNASSKGISAAIINTKANMAVNRGDFVAALDLYLEIAPLYEEMADSANLAIVYENIGLNYRSAANFDQAIKYLKKAILINNKTSENNRLATNFNNLGVILAESLQIDSAISSYYQSLYIYRNMNLSGGLAMTHMNIANLLTKKDSYAEALSHYDSSLFFIERIGSDYGKILYKINQGNLYAKMDNYKAAIPLLESALNECSERGMITEEAEVKKVLYEVWKGVGNYRNALRFFEEYQHLNDSLKSLEIHEKMITLENNYEVNLRELKLAQLQKSLAIASVKARNQWLVFTISAFVFIIAIGLLVVRKRNMEMQNKLAFQKLEKATLDLELKRQELAIRELELGELREHAKKLSSKIENTVQSQNRTVSKALSFSESEYSKFEPELESRYERVIEGFYSKLIANYPDLSPTELRICGFLKMNMTSKEIAILTNRSVRTIENTRNNIRLKMKLPADMKVASYLLAFE